MSRRVGVGRLTMIAATGVLAGAAGVGVVIQPPGRLHADAPPEGILAQVQRLEREVQELRAELDARKIAHYCDPNGVFSVADGWKSEGVSLVVREGDRVLVCADFDVVSDGTAPPERFPGFLWEIKAEGPVSETCRNPKFAQMTEEFCWLTQANRTVFTANDGGPVKFYVHASKVDSRGGLDGRGKIHSFSILAENLGKR